LIKKADLTRLNEKIGRQMERGKKATVPKMKKTEITVPKAIKRRIRVAEAIAVGELAKKMGSRRAK